jgi:chemotaxis protein MotB
LRKKKPEKEANHERWLVSYADFITLLFAFFTTLYAISTVDAQKMGKMVTSMRASFDNNLFASGSRTLSLNPGAGNNPSAQGILETVDLRGASAREMQRIRDMKMPSSAKRAVLSGEGLGQLKKRVESLLSAEVLKGRVQAHIDARGLIISLGEAGVFDSGSDQIKPEGKALLNTIAGSLVSLGNQIRVEGHTDNIPIRNSRFPSNWELSTARATAMICYLIANLGFTPDLLSAAGYAEFRPAASNDTEGGRARNRRVDIVILNPATALTEPR